MTNDILDPRVGLGEIEYEIVGTTESGEYKIKFTSGEFNDIIFNVYGLNFEERDDDAVMHWQYDIHEGTVAEDRKKDFEQEVGDWIIQTIEKSLANNSLIFKGGTDENRTDDTEQPGI